MAGTRRTQRGGYVCLSIGDASCVYPAIPNASIGAERSARYAQGHEGNLCGLGRVYIFIHAFDIQVYEADRR
ncbi:hypothetical protein AF72_12590 [Xylella taiwanensis]|uniref:Uncharacterized protein n=1 Tax=Xylella taiwanensis TaxID=1444770 RepID=Z9JFF1_9GAMM|nr:hypothetical protein AF72_12590 [Xylella taiwanensis]